MICNSGKRYISKMSDLVEKGGVDLGLILYICTCSQHRLMIVVTTGLKRSVYCWTVARQRRPVVVNIP